VRKGLLSKIFKFIGVITCVVITPYLLASGLSITEYRSAKPLACISLVDNEFSLSFIHSVSLTPVSDEYRLLVNDGHYQILQTKERFVAHGQGLPSLIDEPDAVAFEHSDGQFILHLKRNISNLIVRTDKRFENKLHTGDRTINLNIWPDAGLGIKPVGSCQ
jgi:hypothetical protein